MANSVEFVTDNGPASMQRAYTTALNATSGYIRFKIQTLGVFAPIASYDEGGGGTFFLFVDNGFVGAAGDLFIFDGASSTLIRASSSGVWLDIAWQPNGANTDYYYKLASSGTWSGPVAKGTPAFTPETLAVATWPNGAANAVGTVRYGKIVFWNAAQSVGVIQGEAAVRTLVTSTNCFFYNAAEVAGDVDEDQNGANDMTVNGTPTTVADDPGFPTGDVIVSPTPAQVLYFGANF